MSEFRIGETVQVNGVRDGIILKQHSVDLELWKVWFDDLNDWKYMLTSELESTDTLRAEREALAAEVARLREALIGIGFDAAFALDCGDESVLCPALERIHQLADEATESIGRAEVALNPTE